MRTIRRLYFYLVAFVSLEVVAWGVIQLGRGMLGEEVGDTASQLAGALAAILVGIPVFLLHWWIVQRDASRQEEERYSTVRAIYFYGVLLATLVPGLHNLLALANRAFLSLLWLSQDLAYLGADQTSGENLIAIVVNGLLAGYFCSVLRATWREDVQGDDFPLWRRIFRFVWVVYGLVIMSIGVWAILGYLLDSVIGVRQSHWLANGLTFALIGAPLWVFSWRRVVASLEDPGERRSVLRLGFEYALALVGAVGALISLGNVLYQLLLIGLGKGLAADEWILAAREALISGVVFGGVWFFYGRVLGEEMRTFPEEPRRNGLRRLYTYALALVGLVAILAGGYTVGTYIIEVIVAGAMGEGLRESFAGGLAALIIGLPLWIGTWRPMNREASEEGETGEQANRSLVRKAYLYLAVFAGLMGVMWGASVLVYHLLQTVLGSAQPPAGEDYVHSLKVLFLFAGLLAYHGQVLRSDQRRSAALLAKQHAAFPVLILDPGEGQFAQVLFQAIQRKSRDILVASHAATQGAPHESLSPAKAVVLPTSLVAQPPEALRLWLQNFPGQRVIVPEPVEGWVWVGSTSDELEKQSEQVAQVVVRLAEGRTISSRSSFSPGLIAAAVVGGFVLFPLLVGLIGLLAAGLD